MGHETDLCHGVSSRLDDHITLAGGGGGVGDRVGHEPTVTRSIVPPIYRGTNQFTFLQNVT